MLWKIDGYLAIPHELLHVLAYRLIGKPCYYRIGDHYVRSLEPRSFGERLFVLLFPLFVTGGTAMILLCLWAVIYVLVRYPPKPTDYFRVAPVWHQFLLIVATILMLYSGSSVIDIMTAAHLLLQKLRQQPPNSSNDHQSEWDRPQETD
jgi:hypothetical protein